MSYIISSKGTAVRKGFEHRRCIEGLILSAFWSFAVELDEMQIVTKLSMLYQT